MQINKEGSVTPGSWSLVRGTAGCTKTRHLFYTSDLLTYWYYKFCTWV